jgi:hypothetical protein
MLPALLPYILLTVCSLALRLAVRDVHGSPERGALSYVSPSGRPVSPHVAVEDPVKMRLEKA